MLKLFFSNNPKGKAVRDSREKKEVGSVTCSCPDRPMAARLSEWNLSSSSLVAASMGTVFGAKEERSSRPQSRDTVWMGRVRDGRGSGSTFQLHECNWRVALDDKSAQIEVNVRARSPSLGEKKEKKGQMIFHKKKLRCLRSFSRLVMYQQHELVYQRKTGWTERWRRLRAASHPLSVMEKNPLGRCGFESMVSPMFGSAQRVWTGHSSRGRVYFFWTKKSKIKLRLKWLVKMLEPFVPY
jgi:hypothetical protein